MANCVIEIDKQSVVEIELFDTSVAQKFLSQLKWHVSNSSVNNKEAFYGYADEQSVRNSLLSSIVCINNFLRREYIQLPNEIDWEDKWIYNHLHQYFEKLNGEWGKPTRLLHIAPDNVKEAIRDLNFSIHRLESRPYEVNRTLYLSWDKNSYSRQQFDEEDYDFFVDSYSENTVYLNYVEVGKHLLELFHDDLTPTYDAYKNLHYVGAEVVIEWGKSAKPVFTDEFKQWAASYGIDTSNKRLGIGLMPIGTFTGSDNNFTKDSKITNITIKE